MTAKPGHGDHWRAVLGENEGILSSVLEFPIDAPEGVALHRRPITTGADLVQVTARRSRSVQPARLVSAYPEPRATTLLRLTPRELLLWETRVEGWLVVEHPAIGAVTLFVTDLVEHAERYQNGRGEIALEVGGLAYTLQRASPTAGPNRMRPATAQDERFLPDDYFFESDVRGVHAAAATEVLDLEVQGGLQIPVTTHRPTHLAPGQRAQGFVWLTARWPEGQEEQGS